MKSLTVLSWNANGLSARKDELHLALSVNNIDICLISETHSTKETICKIKGYKFYHTFHPSNSARGGSGIFIKENLYHSEGIRIQTDKMQVTTVLIKTNKYTVTMASIYCPPRHTMELNEYLTLFDSLGHCFILGGDFNAKHTFWGSRLTTTKGNVLYRAIQKSNCGVLSTGKPTYWPTDPGKKPDLIDFFITRGTPLNYTKIEDFYDLSSDHSPIKLTLSETVIQKPHNPVLVNNKTDWISFKVQLARETTLDSRMDTPEQVESELEKLINNIQRAAWNSTPEIRRRVHGVNYPREIMSLIREKRKYRKKWQRTRAPSDKTKFNQLTRQLNHEIRLIKNESFRAYLSGLSGKESSDYSLWKAMKSIKRPIMPTSPLKDTREQWVRDNQGKANLFADYLSNIFTPLPGNQNLAESRDQETNIKIPPVTVKEVEDTIKTKINPSKAPGYDLITGAVLKQLPRKALLQITRLVNAAFRISYVPLPWKIAEVIMIPKPGKPPEELPSYRPISLLPVMSKLFEKLLLKRLLPIIEERNIIPNHQFGFRQKHSTIEQVHRITRIIEQALEEKKVCSAVFLDVSKAFDKVWHEGLVYKIRRALPATYAKLLQSYIKNRHFRIKQEESYSQLKEIKAGVPQGSVLGPVLYLIYTSDLPLMDGSTTATFADDTAILAVGENNLASTQKLNESISKIHRWTAEWRITLNETKSVHVDFTNRKFTYVPVYLDKAIIPFANEAKYLGITLDAKIRWKAHVKKKRKELDIKFRKMYWLMGRYSSTSIESKLMLYHQVLKPIWTYGIQLWGCTSRTNREIIERFQSKVLRSIVNAPWYIRNEDLRRDLGVESVTEAITRRATAHQERLQVHVNEEIVHLLDVEKLTRRLKRVKPHDLVR